MGITCKQATDYISRKEEGKLTLHQRYQLWKHLTICSLCQLFDKQNRLLIASLKSLKKEDVYTDARESLSADDKEAIWKAMEKSRPSE